MNDGLIDGFRYNTWATREIIAVCRDLSDAQLNATAVGAYDSIIETLRHLIASEAGYQARLTGEEPSWDRYAGDSPDLDTLASRVDELDTRWERFLEEPFDADRTFIITWHDDIDRDVPAGVILMQALQHAIEHRGQICTILTELGVDTPDYGSNMGLWDWAEVTNRAPQRSS